MCGINGIFAYHSASSAPDEVELLATRDAMWARGPDGSGAWWNAARRCGLGNRRLSILDLSDRAAQPMASEDGRLAVTFNGEIYNCGVLRGELEAAGTRFRTTSDTEVLLHLYARDGAAMVHRLRGMFAFAIWDETRRGLFLARDPYGIKPLYTVNDGRTLRFASQVKALLAGRHVSRDPEPAGVVGFHLFGSVPEPFTLYREVRALPAGTTQWIDARGPRDPEPFANLAAILAEGAHDPAPAHELPDRLRAAALDSVHAHLLADVEVGLFLSGGVDSGALLGLMRDAGQRDIRAITLSFDEFRGTVDDEVPLAARVAERYGAQHIVRRVDRQELLDDLPDILDAMDQPSIDGVNTWFVAKAAKEGGLKVALSGLGGDELFAGYPSFIDVPRWHRRFGPVAAVPGFGRLARAVMRTVAPGFARERPKALGLLEYADSWAGAYLLRRALFLPYELTDVMEPALVREGMRRLEPLRRLRESLSPDPGSVIGRVCALESSHYLRDQLLRDADWAGMAHSLEIRVPLVDATLLAALAPSIPALRMGRGKAALARTPSIALADEIVSRLKTGFQVPTGHWLAVAGAMGSSTTTGASVSMGVVSRRWSRIVFAEWAGGRGGVAQGDGRGGNGRELISRGLSLADRLSGAAESAGTRTVLIFRIGSLGDTVVALPCFNYIARAFPNSRRVLLTCATVSPTAVPVERVLGNSGLIDDVIHFPQARRPHDFLTLWAQMRQSRGTVLVYVADRDIFRTFRDVLFFRICGIRQIIGASLAREVRGLRIDPETGYAEHESQRLARSVDCLGRIDLHDPDLWDLHLRSEERRAADAALAPLGDRDFIAVSIGGRAAAKDWGDANWQELVQLLGLKWSPFALVFFGAGDEFARSAGLAAAWPGTTLNLCGRLNPRESAAAMQRALLYLGHDNGPMHLAAVVGTRCVAIFGNYNIPRRWHPMGKGHRVIHHLRGIREISAEEVEAAVNLTMSELLGSESRRNVAVTV